MVTVSVAASWRLGRVEINTPYGVPWSISGYGEILLQEPETPSEGASIFRGMPFAGGEPSKTYGSMPGAPVMRALDAVMNDSVEIDGETTTFAEVIEVMKAFFEKWRVEDAAKPPVTPLMPGPGAELTPIPPPPLPPSPTAEPRPGDD